MDIALYGLTVLIWGSSWIAVKLQLGVVSPDVSLVYRFAIAAVIMLLVCRFATGRLRFGMRAHLRMMAQGLFLFSTNYYLIYLGSQHLTSGLVAVAFSVVVVFNIILGAMVFRLPIRPRVALGAAVGMIGIGLVFWPEIKAFSLDDEGALGLLLSLGGTLSASLGMLISGSNQRAGIPVIPANAYGMTWGAVFMTAAALVQGSPFVFDSSASYVWSLLFLAILATVVGFWSYLTLLGRIGADRAAYATVLFPIIALTLSTMFEGYTWGLSAIAGVGLVLAGNVLVLSKSKVPDDVKAGLPPAEHDRA